ncbi:helix-turn-helix domain-containing protein [Pontibacter silvestris]|uniref:Helix-turn-helix domain-containing protein n=1 Tax=Pontibacter silvestris TaxID=2305183 RepID=A0ABW4X2J8_9BACT|nr:helix-turn-helix domain-containing protein [Pontibacter silvestris]MCC9135110.1 helix-turn-helix domain-containing protein [Pontibacter silvestris]
MGKIRVVELNEKERKALAEGFRTGKSHAFRKNCQLVLLKSEGRASKEVGGILQINVVTVNSWLDRYEAEGIEGLRVKPGRGRKQVLDPEADKEKVRQAVEKERQRLKQAKLILEQDLGKQFSLKTLKRFLKKVAADTKG